MIPKSGNRFSDKIMLKSQGRPTGRNTRVSHTRDLPVIGGARTSVVGENHQRAYLT
jgi:hypothetical protein